jgi:hypothetical protein
MDIAGLNDVLSVRLTARREAAADLLGRIIPLGVGVPLEV